MAHAQAKTPSTLANLPNSTTSVVTGLEGDGVLLTRLRELGFIVGAQVTVAGRALFGEPIMVEVRGSTVALRKAEAACVLL